MPSTDKICHFLAAVFFAGLSTSAIGGHPLEDAAYEAATLCARMDGIETFNDCRDTAAPSADLGPAKDAIRRMYKERSAFMRECDTGRGMLRQCQEQADLYMWTGSLRDVRWTVQHTDQATPSPLSGTPR